MKQVINTRDFILFVYTHSKYLKRTHTRTRTHTHSHTHTLCIVAGDWLRLAARATAPTGGPAALQGHFG
jgi:hypothetical protein